MKFYIDDKEIETVIKGAEISGSFDLPSRAAVFSYLYCDEDYMRHIYKAKTGSDVLIQNDNGENLFKGSITQINYSKDEHKIHVQAQDMFYDLLKRKVKGRYKGQLLSLLKQVIKKYKLFDKITSFLEKEINVLSLGNLSVYDIILVAARKIFGNEVKLYLDGGESLRILVPSLSEPKINFIVGKDIISASFSTKDKNNISNLTVNGNEAAVSGAVIKITDEKGNFGEFIIQRDKHIYGDIYTTVLDVKERKIV